MNNAQIGDFISFEQLLANLGLTESEIDGADDVDIS